MAVDKAMDVTIDKTWDGEPIGEIERVRVSIDLEEHLRVSLEATFHGDPPPEGRAGRLWGLWGYEVVEVFLVGEDERYLEIELGPYGHHLILSLHGVRQVTSTHMPISVHTKREGRRWRGEIVLDAGLVPPGLHSFNAYAIHGQGEARRYLAAFEVPGDEPDFHRLSCFGPWR